MLAEQRYQKILEALQQEGSVKSAAIRQQLGVSGETVRRDLEAMEQMGLLRRTHGGALPTAASELDTEASPEDSGSYASYASFHKRQTQNPYPKLEVARLAANYIQEGQCIALDSGTTAHMLAQVIKERFHDLTVVTNSLAVLRQLGSVPGITVVLTGGIYRPEESALSSELATLIFSKLNVDTFFLTTCGVSVERGVTYQRMEEIVVQEKMMQAASRTVMITDSSKLGVNSLIKMCDIDKISMIVTDSDASPEQTAAFEEAGVPVITPNTNS